MSEQSNEVDVVDIEAIVKKPRKTKMSTVVSKAVLLKQISDADLQVETKVKQTTKKVSKKADCVSNPSEATPPPTPVSSPPTSVIEIPIPPPLPTIPLVTPCPLLQTTTVPNVCEESVFVGECALCSCKFKSKVLFNRHPNTLRHKLNADKANHIRVF